jgi:DNA-binding NarL/FixJ family response regulator
MRWRVLLVRAWQENAEPVLDAIRHVGIDPSYEIVDTEPALHAALTREDWDVIIYDPAMKSAVPIEKVYQQAPATAVVLLTSHEDMADELARVAAIRAGVE